jgi:preprotein translocase subunit SecF
MLQVFHHTNFRLMWGTKYFFLALSAMVLLVAVGAMVFRGFNYGIDFAGGTSVQLKFREAPRVEELRAALEGAGLGDVNIQRIGRPEDREVLIRVEMHDQGGGAGTGTEGGEISSKVLAALRGGEAAPPGEIDLNTASEGMLREWLEARLGAPPAEAAGGGPTGGAAAIAAAIVAERDRRGGLFASIDDLSAVPGVTQEVLDLLRAGATLGEFALRGIDFVGPTAGRELMSKTQAAISLAVVGILIYVWLRFHRVAWGLAAIVALVHDVTISAGAMALTGREMSLPVVAALLTILGYSINDTIVVFDRIRENLRLYREHDFEQVVNASVNQTLSRTVLTSFTAFISVTALFIYGGDKLNPLAFCLMVGMVAGTYSTIFVASALLVLAHRHLGEKFVKV